MKSFLQFLEQMATNPAAPAAPKQDLSAPPEVSTAEIARQTAERQGKEEAIEREMQEIVNLTQQLRENLIASTAWRKGDRTLGNSAPGALGLITNPLKWNIQNPEEGLDNLVSRLPVSINTANWWLQMIDERLNNPFFQRKPELKSYLEKAKQILNQIIPKLQSIKGQLGG